MASLQIITNNMFMIPHFIRISGNAASDKNIKDGVCAQIEKNFAKAKWKVILFLKPPPPHTQHFIQCVD